MQQFKLPSFTYTWTSDLRHPSVSTHGHDQLLMHLGLRQRSNLDFLRVLLKDYSKQFRLMFTVAAFLFLGTLSLCNTHTNIMDHRRLLHLTELCTAYLRMYVPVNEVELSSVV